MADEFAMPDTDSREVAALAVAWEIVKRTRRAAAPSRAAESGLAEYTNALIKVYRAILEQAPIEE